MSPVARSSLPLVVSKIGPGVVDILLGAAHFGGDFANLFVAFLLHLGQLRSQLLIGGDLIVANRFGAAAGFGELGLRHADFLLGNLDIALQIGEAGIGLVELSAEQLVLILGLGEVGLELCLRGMAHVSKHDHRHESEHRTAQRSSGACPLLS